MSSRGTFCGAGTTVTLSGVVLCPMSCFFRAGVLLLLCRRSASYFRDVDERVPFWPLVFGETGYTGPRPDVVKLALLSGLPGPECLVSSELRFRCDFAAINRFGGRAPPPIGTVPVLTPKVFGL